jgi:hypothetical protein
MHSEQQQLMISKEDSYWRTAYERNDHIQRDDSLEIGLQNMCSLNERRGCMRQYI